MHAAALSRSLAVVFAGLFAFVMIDLVITENLRFYLNDSKFETLVLVGGILLGLVTLLEVRAMLIPGTGHVHDREHEHADGHDHAHDHGHAHAHGHDHGTDPHHEEEHDHGECCGHGDDCAHDHDHDHGAVSYWRLIVLAFPLVVLCGGLAPEQLSGEALSKRMSARQKSMLDALEATDGTAAVATGPVTATDIASLDRQAKEAEGRDFWQPADPQAPRPRAAVVGRFVPDSRYDDRYHLLRSKIICCVADATPVGVLVVGKPQADWEAGEWIQVVGPVRFLELPGPGGTAYVPVIEQHRVGPAEQQPYLQ